MKKLRGKKGMSKKLFLLAVLVVSVVCFSVNAAFAAGSFEVFTTTDCVNHPHVDEFDINGTSPYLYLNFPSSSWAFELTVWYAPVVATLPDYYTALFNTGASDTWCASFDNITFYDASHTAFNWSNIKSLGEWKIGACYNDGTHCVCDDTTFTMTPEPATSALFLIGGTGIALMRRRKAGKSKA